MSKFQGDLCCIQRLFLWVTVHKDFFYGSLYTDTFLWITVHKDFFMGHCTQILFYGSLYTKTFLWVTVHRYFFMGQCTQRLFYGSLYTKTFLWVNVHTDFFMGQYTDTLFYLLHCILHYYCIDLYYELCFIFYRHRLIICGLGHKFVVQI
jgi:hypothetical protein